MLFPNAEKKNNFPELLVLTILKTCFLGAWRAKEGNLSQQRR
jgi:hypothetical protein